MIRELCLRCQHCSGSALSRRRMPTGTAPGAVQASSSVVPPLGDWRCMVTAAVPVGLPAMTAGAVLRLAEPAGSTASEVIGATVTRRRTSCPVW